MKILCKNKGEYKRKAVGSSGCGAATLRGLTGRPEKRLNRRLAESGVADGFCAALRCQHGNAAPPGVLILFPYRSVLRRGFFRLSLRLEYSSQTEVSERRIPTALFCQDAGAERFCPVRDLPDFEPSFSDRVQ